MQELPQLPWLREPVRLQLLSGQLRVLVDVRRERCCDCGSGVRITSTWASARGRGEVVSWCGHCFNAVCRQEPLSACQRARLHELRGAFADAPERSAWPAARLALEDLERRGLL